MHSVTVIVPTAHRPEMLERCIKNFLAQDYGAKEIIVVGKDQKIDIEHYNKINVALVDYYFDGSIGQKRNVGCGESVSEIILFMDDDDQYAPDWISKSVEALISSGADCVGLSSAYFHRTADNQVFHFSNKPNTQLYLCGATLCFWRKVWENNPFPDTSIGEDTIWQTNIKRATHNYTAGFLATLHGANTCSHKSIPLMKKVPANEALSIIGRFGG